MRKLFIISFEGLNIELLKQYMDIGKLHNFSKLSEEGYLNRVKCSKVPYEASGIASTFSGMNESKHGVLSYWKAKNKNYIPEVYSSEEIKDFMFWRQKRFENYKAGIVNIFGTHPVYEVNGSLISYAMNRTLRYTYPDNLLRDFASKGFNYVQDMGAFFKNEGKENFLRQVQKVESMRHEICKKMYVEDYDIYVINYTCIDRVCHFYMSEVFNDTIPLEEKAVYRMYKLCDSILGDLFEVIEKSKSELILFSSVGFGKLKRFVEINPYLEKTGFLNNISNRTIDWERTVAFEAPQGTHGININTKSFYSKGTVKDIDYEKVLNEVAHALAEMKNPDNNNPMFSKVIPGFEYYQNHYNAPDIILEPYDLEYLPYGDTYWADIVGRHNQTGWHRSESVWGKWGGSLSTDSNVDAVKSLEDIYEHISDTLTFIERS